MDVLYQTDKAKFYRELFKLKSEKKIFENIFFYADFIPFKESRKEIFSELQRLFNKGNWLAFFALALPQVEGLFTDMLYVVNPDGRGKALSDKVEKIRPAYFLSESYFDYFQYIVPEIRNKFSHTGFESNLKLKSLDLLTDIEHLLFVYYELDNPFVVINRLLKRRNPDDFIEYKQFASFFSNLNSLHPTQHKQIKDALHEFCNNFLVNECQLEYIAEGFIEPCEKLLQKAQHMIEIVIDTEMAIKVFEDKNIKLLIEEKFESLKRLKRNILSELEDINTYHIVYRGMSKYCSEWYKKRITHL